MGQAPTSRRLGRGEKGDGAVGIDAGCRGSLFSAALVPGVPLRALSRLATMSRTFFLLTLFVAGIATAGGCALLSLEEPAGKPVRLPPPRMAPDSVVLEFLFVRMPVSEREAYNEIWSAADEQDFPAELRRQLADNGFRCGVLGQQIPDALRDRLNAPVNTYEERSEDIDTSDAEVDRSPRRKQCRAGRRAKIVVSKTHESLSVLTREGGAVRGRVVEKAQCLFALKPYPQGDGQVRLDVTPEVEHGEVKQQWVGGNGTMMQRMGKDRIVLDAMRVGVTLAPGQSLMLSATEDAHGLGDHFFVETAGGTLERTILLIRVAGTQHDDLFAPGDIPSPLATPVD